MPLKILITIKFQAKHSTQKISKLQNLSREPICDNHTNNKFGWQLAKSGNNLGSREQPHFRRF